MLCKQCGAEVPTKGPGTRGMQRSYCDKNCSNKAWQSKSGWARKRKNDYYASRSAFLREKLRDEKRAAFDAYGGPKCSCCGETLFEGLTIDHIEPRVGDSLHGGALYRRLRFTGYPPGYQVLCATCNLAKGTDDHCPHEDLKVAWG